MPHTLLGTPTAGSSASLMPMLYYICHNWAPGPAHHGSSPQRVQLPTRHPRTVRLQDKLRHGHRADASRIQYAAQPAAGGVG